MYGYGREKNNDHTLGEKIIIRFTISEHATHEFMDIGRGKIVMIRGENFL